MLVGTRGSKLALTQTNIVIEQLKNFCKEKIELKVIKTSGDLFLEKELKEFSGQGAFVKELDHLIVKKKLDIAVHSMKDIPTEMPKELIIGAILKRTSKEDVFISRFNSIEVMPKNAIIGTSSTRRKAQLLRIRDDLQIKNLRGNVETRIRKLKNGEYDAIFLAKAGLERLGLLSSINYQNTKQKNSELRKKGLEDKSNAKLEKLSSISTLNFKDEDSSEIKAYNLPFITSAGQGAIGVVCRKNSREEKLLKKIDDENTRIEVEVERTILKELGGGCIVPFGISAFLKGNKIKVRAEILSLNGKKSVMIEEEILKDDCKNSSIDYKQEIMRNILKGALEIAKELKENGGGELIVEVEK